SKGGGCGGIPTTPAKVPPAVVAAAQGRQPLPEEITHKRPDCRSGRSWQHVWGDFFCLDCWPPTDPLAIARNEAEGRRGALDAPKPTILILDKMESTVESCVDEKQKTI